MKEQMMPRIYDEEEGISIEFPIQLGYTIKVYLYDKTAQEMINIIQNKLNARL